jgi:ribonuclease P protein component
MKRMHALRKQSDFQRVFRRGRRLDKELFCAWYLLTNRNYARVAFVTSRSVDKRAVVRNAVRRRAREWVRTHTPLFTNTSDVVFLFKKSAAIATRKKLRSELEDAVRRMLRVGHTTAS